MIGQKSFVVKAETLRFAQSDKSKSRDVLLTGTPFRAFRKIQAPQKGIVISVRAFSLPSEQACNSYAF